MTTSSIHPALEKRAIPSAFVSGKWGNRYVPFAQGDWTTFAAEHTNPEARWHKGLVAQSSGLIVNRWDVHGARIESYIRFDSRVRYRTCVRPGHPTKACGDRGCRWGWKTTKYIYPSKNALGDTSANGSTSIRLYVRSCSVPAAARIRTPRVRSTSVSKDASRPTLWPAQVDSPPQSPR